MEQDYGVYEALNLLKGLNTLDKNQAAQGSKPSAASTAGQTGGDEPQDQSGTGGS